MTVGTWMLALNTTHLDDRRLCETKCSASSLAVYDIPVCSGLCEPARQLVDLHAAPEVRRGGGAFGERPGGSWARV